MAGLVDPEAGARELMGALAGVRFVAPTPEMPEIAEAQAVLVTPDDYRAASG